MAILQQPVRQSRMKRDFHPGVSWPGAYPVALLVLLVAAHLGIVASTIWHDRPRAFTLAVLCSLLLLSSPTLFGVFDVAKNEAVFDPSGQWPRHALYVIVLSKVLPTVILYLTSIAYLSGSGLMSPAATIRSSAHRAMPPAGAAGG